MTGTGSRHGQHKPRIRQQTVDQQAEAYGGDHHRSDIDHGGTASVGARQYHHRSEIRRRPGHQHHKSYARAEPFHHQRHGDRYGSGGAHIHRHSHRHHRQHGQQTVVAQSGKETVGHGHSDQSSHYQAHYKPSAHASHHIDKAVRHRPEQTPRQRHRLRTIIAA